MKLLKRKFTRVFFIVLLFLWSQGSYAQVKCSSIFGKRSEKGKQKVGTSPQFEKFKAGFQEALTQVGREGVLVLQHSWPVFSDPRIDIVQVGPYKTSLQTGKESVDLEWLNEAGLKPGEIFNFNYFYSSYAHLQNPALPGVKLPGSNAPKSVNPFSELLFAPGSPAQVISTPNQFSLLPELLKSRERSSEYVKYDPLQKITMEPPVLLLPMRTWRGTPGVSSQGMLSLEVKKHNVGMQTYLFGYKLLFNLLEQIVHGDPLMDPRFQKLAEQIWEMRFNLGDLEFKDDPKLFVTTDSPSHRFAMTGNNPGDPIYLNSKLLLPGESTRIEDAVALLGHEMGHQAGLKDGPDRFLDQFGALLKQKLEAAKEEKEVTSSQGKTARVEVYHFTKKNGQSFSQVLMQDEGGWSDLTPSFFANIQGSTLNFRIGNIISRVEEGSTKQDLLSYTADLYLGNSPMQKLKFIFIGSNRRQDGETKFKINDRFSAPMVEVMRERSSDSTPSNFRAIRSIDKNSIVEDKDSLVWEIDLSIDTKKAVKAANIVFTKEAQIQNPALADREMEVQSIELKEGENGLELKGIHKFPKDVSQSEYVVKFVEVLYEDGKMERLVSRFQIGSGVIGQALPPIKAKMELSGQFLGSVLGFNISTFENPAAIHFKFEDIGKIEGFYIDIQGRDIYRIYGDRIEGNPLVQDYRITCEGGQCQLSVLINHAFFVNNLVENYIGVKSVYLSDHRYSEGFFQFSTNSFIKFE